MAAGPLTRRLAAEGLCASVHHFSPVRTTYRWNGELIERTEGRALLHTRTVLVEQIVERMKAEHPRRSRDIRKADRRRDRDYLRWSSPCILVPVLARGQVRMIGAMTLQEYRAHLEKFAALERRFQPVRIDVP